MLEPLLHSAVATCLSGDVLPTLPQQAQCLYSNRRIPTIPDSHTKPLHNLNLDTDFQQQQQMTLGAILHQQLRVTYHLDNLTTKGDSFNHQSTMADGWLEQWLVRSLEPLDSAVCSKSNSVKRSLVQQLLPVPHSEPNSRCTAERWTYNTTS